MSQPTIQLTGGEHGGDRVLRVSLGSKTKPGTKSSLMLPVNGLSERELFQGVGAILVKLIEHQGRYFMDNHDERDTLAAGVEAMRAFLHNPANKVWINRDTWSAAKQQKVKTSEVKNMYRPEWT